LRSQAESRPGVGSDRHEEAVISKSSEKPKKVAKKQPQKTLKEKRAEKRSKPKAA